MEEVKYVLGDLVIVGDKIATVSEEQVNLEMELIEESFKAGIDWYLSNLWHTANEIPPKNALIYVMCPITDGIYSRIVLASNDYKRKRLDFNITRWLYVSDLEKGGTHE